MQMYNIVDIGHYKMLMKQLAYYGISPNQNNQISNIIVMAILLSSVTFIFPVTMHLFDAIRDRSLAGFVEDLPLVITAGASIMKILNIRSNKTRFRILFEYIAREWRLLESKTELCMLQKFTEQGRVLAALYRRTLLIFLVIFLFIPLFNPIMDMIVPLNETRPRHHVFKVDYLILDVFEHFYAVYVHLSASSTFVVLMIITADSLYITIIHHACGLFAVCGYQVQQATENNSLGTNEACKNNGGYEEFKQCVVMHYEAILFHKILDKCCRNLYLIEIGLNILAISLTAVEAVVYFNRPEEFVRLVLFLMAQNFHLYIISLPGQVLLDQSTELGDKIYASNWYQIPVNLQRLLYTMQIRCNKPCILSAGGLYEMKIESFGITVKACLSYITMFLSLME